jgi:hypothetical protein
VKSIWYMAYNAIALTLTGTVMDALSALRKKATLVIAKLDRLGRTVAFISALMESAICMRRQTARQQIDAAPAGHWPLAAL